MHSKRRSSGDQVEIKRWSPIPRHFTCAPTASILLTCSLVEAIVKARAKPTSNTMRSEHSRANGVKEVRESRQDTADVVERQSHVQAGWAGGWAWRMGE